MDAPHNQVDTNPRVLIVDDEAAICLLLKESLSLAGFHCQTAASGQEALEILQQKEFDALISDLRMPGMSGLGLLEAARAKYPKMILLLATGDDDLQTGVEAKQDSVHECLMKPFRLATVVTTLNRALENKPR